MRSTYEGIEIDLLRDYDLTDQARELLEKFYCTAGGSPQTAFARAALCFSGGDTELAQRIYDAASKGWFMFSSPILANAVAPDEPLVGMPISCFLTYVPDDLNGLIEHQSEFAWLSVKGGGVGGHWSDVRAYSEKAPGPIPFMGVTNASVQAYRQGKTRKGAYAAYLDCDHPDIEEFIQFKVPTGGDVDRKFFNMFNAVNITDAFMEAVRNDSPWELRDPASKEVRSTVRARELWQRLLETRFRTGSPYLNFIDTANASLNGAQRKAGHVIRGSNLCNEIHLVTDRERTAVCCLSSLNIEKIDEWENTTLVRDLVRFLDNVLEFFIQNAPPEMSKAVYSAKMERSLGLGAMGFHAYLQRKGIPFESLSAQFANQRIFSKIALDAKYETELLAKERGEPEDLKGTGTRNAHLLAIAPNANSSMIVGTSPSIEPWASNTITHRTRAGTHLIRNPYLQKVLEKHGKATEEVWGSIIANEGSVQHLEFLTDDERDVFKTAYEIDQRWIVTHASERQQHICQGQSVNLFFYPDADRAYVNAVHLQAHSKGLKGLYYLRSGAAKKADNISIKAERRSLKDFDDECLSCQG